MPRGPRAQGALKGRRFLSPLIKNEIIALLAKEVEDDVKKDLKEAPFFSLILDTTQDASKRDQLSEVYRYVKIVKDDDGKPLEVKVCETFSGFTEVCTVYALKVRLPDVLKSLTRIILTSKKPNERSEAETLKKRVENFEFVFLLVLQCKILEIINIPSKSLQSESMDLFKAKDLLQNALASVSALREKFQHLVTEASKICEKWGIQIQARFQERRSRSVKRNYDGLAVDETSHTPEEAFRISTFLPMIDTIISQLNRRFEGTRRTAEKYEVIQPKFLSESTDEELRVKAEEFAKNFPDDVSPMFPAQILSLRTAMKDRISKMSSVMELATFLIVENYLLSSSFPDVCTACLMFLTVPVTVAKAERSFSKLRIIKNYLRCSISQERLSHLALLSIEHERARNIDFSGVIDKFANAKARKKKFF